MNSEDTIVAISSAVPPAGQAAVSIVRLSGPEAFAAIRRFLTDSAIPYQRGLFHVPIHIQGLVIPACVYVFPSPHSYTGQDMAEVHITAAGPVVEAVHQALLSWARQAEPGEFTLRAYLNGRMDLSQAEAVAQIISGSNAAQVGAAEKLLAGNLSIAVADIRRQILDLLSRLEAGLDFAEEDIEFISAEQAAEVLARLAGRLEDLLGSTIQYERMIDLPSAGIAGAVSAGKSSLLNALLGRDRSMVSARGATTRDVLAEILPLGDLDCVLFDCAGLTPEETDNPLDALARQAARSALAGADLVLFCVDVAKENLEEDRSVYSMLAGRPFLALAAQCDKVAADMLSARLERLRRAFGFAFLPTSARGGRGLDALKARLREVLLNLRRGAAEADQRIAVNQRHRQILSEASAALAEAKGEIGNGRPEIAAMCLRTAWGRLGGIEREDIEEQILDQIFSRFCVGK